MTIKKFVFLFQVSILFSICTNLLPDTREKTTSSESEQERKLIFILDILILFKHRAKMKYSVNNDSLASRKGLILMKRQSRKDSVSKAKEENKFKKSETITITRWWWLKDFNKDVRDISKRSRGSQSKQNSDN